MKDIFTGQRPP